MLEIWRQIKDYPRYSVSNLGRVKNNDTDKVLKGYADYKGYQRVCIHCRGERIRKDLKVHRLVAEAFVPNPDNKPQVNHIDGNKQNNAASNLEFCTNQENQLHAYFEPTCDIEILKSQLKTMNAYRATLIFRASIEEIELPEVEV